MTPHEMFTVGLEALGWSRRTAAAHLGEHPTTVLRWAHKRLDMPDAVPPWAWRVSEPLRLQPTLEDLGGEPSDMTGAELDRLREALHWSVAYLAVRTRRSLQRTNTLLDGRGPVLQPMADFMRASAAPLIKHPLPRPWSRNVVVGSPPAPGVRPIERAIPNSPRQQAKRARIQEAQRLAQAEHERIQRQRTERRVMARELADQGKTLSQIGAALGVSHQAAHKLVQRGRQMLEEEKHALSTN